MKHWAIHTTCEEFVEIEEQDFVKKLTSFAQNMYPDQAIDEKSISSYRETYQFLIEMQIGRLGAAHIIFEYVLPNKRMMASIIFMQPANIQHMDLKSMFP